MKLSENEADVAEATNLPINNNLLTLNILTSLSHTLTQALSLSYTCHVTNPPKLKTQNDVDSIISHLQNHIHDCDVIVNSSPLHDDVIITTKRESTRAECRSIMTGLQIGESRDSHYHHRELRRKRLRVFFVDEEDAVEVLLRVAKSVTVLAQEYGFGCLSNLLRVIMVLGSLGYRFGGGRLGLKATNLVDNNLPAPIGILKFLTFKIISPRFVLGRVLWGKLDGKKNVSQRHLSEKWPHVFMVKELVPRGIIFPTACRWGKSD
ncbi:hypothetical protein Tco_1532129 [Tanacetum coccineum]